MPLEIYTPSAPLPVTVTGGFETSGTADFLDASFFAFRLYGRFFVARRIVLFFFVLHGLLPILFIHHLMQYASWYDIPAVLFTSPGPKPTPLYRVFL